MIRLAIQRSGGLPEAFTSERDDVLIGSSDRCDVRVPGDEALPYVLLYASPAGWRWRNLGTGGVDGDAPGGMLGPSDAITVKGVRISVDNTGFAETAEATADEVATTPDPPRKLPPRPPPPVDVPNPLLVGMPVGSGFSGVPVEAFRPHLEVFDAGATTARKIPLGKEPILFGSDPGCHVKITGFKVPSFVATIETLHERVTVRKVAGGLLGPRVMLDGEPLKSESTLSDGQRLFIGEVTVFVRLRKR